MPPPWAAGAQGRIIGELHGQTTINVMHFATNDTIDDEGNLDTILLALAEALRACVIETLLPAVTSDWKLLRTDARRIHPSPSDPIIASADPNAVGELSPTSHSFASSLVHIRSGRGGKRGRGRIFLPPPGESEVLQSTMDAPTLVLLAAFLTCVGAKFMGANKQTPWQLGVYSRKEDAALGKTFDNAFFQAVSLNPVADLAIMGSRRKGRGV